MQTQVMDVTLRDGGYLNDWKFERQAIMETCRFSQQLDIDKFEIGYVSDENHRTLIDGCPVDFLEEVSSFFPREKMVGMLRPNEKNVLPVLRARAPYIGLIRIPTTPKSLSATLELAEIVKSCGIEVSINIILASLYSVEQRHDLLQAIAASKADLAYYADSRGALLPADMEPLIAQAMDIWDRPFGFHAHNHLGHAIENSRIAIEQGCSYTDGSMNGYGYGGGNTRLGELLALVSSGAVDDKIEAEIEAFCQQHLSLELPDEHYYHLCHLMALKNIDHEWMDNLLEQFDDRIESVLKALPKRPYTDSADVIALAASY